MHDLIIRPSYTINDFQVGDTIVVISDDYVKEGFYKDDQYVVTEVIPKRAGKPKVYRTASMDELASGFDTIRGLTIDGRVGVWCINHPDLSKIIRIIKKRS
jgi:hypothetical protein